jgi:hypothetical protein
LTAYQLSSDVQSLDHKSQTYAVDLANYGVTDISATNLGYPVAITYDGYGTTTTNGTIVLQLGGYSRTITISSSTGLATITGN